MTFSPYCDIICAESLAWQAFGLRPPPLTRYCAIDDFAKMYVRAHIFAHDIIYTSTEKGQTMANYKPQIKAIIDRSAVVRSKIKYRLSVIIIAFTYALMILCLCFMISLY